MPAPIIFFPRRRSRFKHLAAFVHHCYCSPPSPFSLSGASSVRLPSSGGQLIFISVFTSKCTAAYLILRGERILEGSNHYKKSDMKLVFTGKMTSCNAKLSSSQILNYSFILRLKKPSYIRIAEILKKPDSYKMLNRRKEAVIHVALTCQ
jgi:hypothetical protein